MQKFGGRRRVDCALEMRWVHSSWVGHKKPCTSIAMSIHHRGWDRTGGNCILTFGLDCVAANLRNLHWSTNDNDVERWWKMCCHCCGCCRSQADRHVNGTGGKVRGLHAYLAFVYAKHFRRRTDRPRRRRRRTDGGGIMAVHHIIRWCANTFHYEEHNPFHRHCIIALNWFIRPRCNRGRQTLIANCCTWVRDLMDCPDQSQLSGHPNPQSAIRYYNVMGNPFCIRHTDNPVHHIIRIVDHLRTSCHCSAWNNNTNIGSSNGRAMQINWGEQKKVALVAKSALQQIESCMASRIQLWIFSCRPYFHFTGRWTLGVELSSPAYHAYQEWRGAAGDGQQQSFNDDPFLSIANDQSKKS